MKKISLVALLFLIPASGFAATPQPVVSCQDPALGKLDVTQNGSELQIKTEFTYDLFDKIHDNLFVPRNHVPGDMHQAAMIMTIPTSACPGSIIGRDCILDPAGGTFETDFLGARPEIKIQYFDLRNDLNGVRLALSVIRNGRAVAAFLEFPISECK